MRKLIGLAGLSGKRAIKEIVVKPTKDTLSVLATSPDESVAISLSINSNPLGIDKQIGITNLSNVEKYISLFTDEPKIVIKDNRLVLSEGRKRIASLLKSPEYVTSKIAKEKYETIKEVVADGEVITINSKIIKKIKDYMGAVGVEAFKLTIKGKELLIEVGNENTDIVNDVIELEKAVEKEVSVVLGEAFIDATSKLNLDFTLTLKKDAPVLVNSESQTYKYEALVALYG